MSFTEKELKQILMLVQDMPQIMDVVLARIPGLSIAGAKLDMLQIQLKAEAMLNELTKAAKFRTAEEAWAAGDPNKVQDLKAPKIENK